MTDNRTTELRKLLDERGVEYEAYRDVKNRCITKWRTCHGAFVFFAVEKEGKLFVETASDTEHSAICTPEQAIAVTLGGERETELRDALNEVAERWAIAQVEAEDYAKRCMLLEVLVQDWQALYEHPDYGDCVRLRKRMQALGIEVIDE